jgi:hypothetical protein
LKRATDNAKKEYLENICNEIMGLQRAGGFDGLEDKRTMVEGDTRDLKYWN